MLRPGPSSRGISEQQVREGSRSGVLHPFQGSGRIFQQTRCGVLKWLDIREDAKVLAELEEEAGAAQGDREGPA